MFYFIIIYVHADDATKGQARASEDESSVVSPCPEFSKSFEESYHSFSEHLGKLQSGGYMFPCVKYILISFTYISDNISGLAETV